MPQLTDIRFWTKNLGHLPIHLTPSAENRFIMLNGISGNFCLHISDSADTEEVYFSQSWSSNTKNFLLVNNENVKLYNWHKEIKQEQISFQSVQNNLDKFYNYLVAKSYKSDRDVVPVILDIFKQFRTLTTEYQNPVNALNLLFVLLASIEDEDIDNLDRQKWGISDITLPNDFDAFVERFKQGTGKFIPDLNLILRHSAGSLFQEAQKEVLFFDSQIDLFGTFSGSMSTKNLLYSSIHYTPSYLARSVVENALNSLDLVNLDEISILDPACGSAEFLVEALKQLKEKNYTGRIKIKGYDTSETAINTSIFLLNYEKRNVWNENLSFEVKLVEDSLTENWGEEFTIILMNPPFISWELLDSKDKRDAVKQTLAENFIAKPNQASAFFYKAIRNLKSGGVLGCVIPSSLFTSDSYLKLRIEVTETINIELLGKLGNFVFEDALTDVSIFIGTKPKQTNNLPTLLWTRNEKGVVHDSLRELRKMQYGGEITKDKVDFSIYKPAHFPIISDSWKPVSFKENILIRDLKLYIANNKLSKVSDVFDVLQGIRPGNKKVFVITEEEFFRLPENEQKYFLPSIDNEAVNIGRIVIKNYAWYPYNKKLGTSLFSSEDELLEKIPYFYKNYLQPNKPALESRKKQIPNWWSLSDRAPRLLPLNSSIISTEFGNSSSFAIDPAGSYIVERGYAWKAKKDMSKDDFYFYLALFSSPFFNKLLSIYSKQLAGGKWYDLGKKSTKEIPIPNIHKIEVKNNSAYLRMVDLGKRLSEGDNYVTAVLDDIISVYYPHAIF